MNESGNTPRLRQTQHWETGVAPNPNGCIWPELVQDFSNLEKTLYQLEWQTKIFYQRATVVSGNIQPFYFVSSKWHFFHFHFALGAYKQDLCTFIHFL